MTQIDWSKLDGVLDTAVTDAAKHTDDKLAAQVSSLTRLTDAEVKALFPEPADLRQLAKLMQIVKSAHDRNTQINHVVKNIDQLAGAIVTIAKHFV